MIHAVRALYKPELYQGPRRLARYFEGWYFKVTSSTRAFALIPGVSRSPDDPHAFVQFIDGTAGTSSYHRFPLDAFVAGKSTFEISVAGQEFSAERLRVDLGDIHADLQFTSPTRWRGTLLQPGTMGWYSFVPFMECRHGIIVMDAVAEGAVDHDPVSGRLYLEKDYGRSFPNAWIWLQSNSFSEDGVSVTSSIANVPFLGGAFTGFLSGISVGGEVHKFTTYLGCRIESLQVHDRSVEIVLGDGVRRLSLHAVREPGAELVAPHDGAMRGRIVETLRSSVDVELTISGSTVYSGRGASAGLEVVNHEHLLTPALRR